ncbi:MAG: hypothetical protein K6F21_01170 [Bacteroidales bacterium]|nr:hypothetical protein [Bacteroidales bacterium]
MKNYLIHALVSAVVYTAILVAVNAIFGELQSFCFYLVSAVIFGVVFGVYHYLVEKKSAKKSK